MVCWLATGLSMQECAYAQGAAPPPSWTGSRRGRPRSRSLPPEPATQAAFRAAIFDGAPPVDVTAPDLSEAARRFAVYRNNVVSSLVDALADTFPVTQQLVGDIPSTLREAKIGYSGTSRNVSR